MKALKRILFALTLCGLLANMGCGPKVYVNEETKVDTTTGEVEHYKETRIKE